MKKEMKKAVIIILIYLFLSTTLQAGETIITSNFVISDGDVYDVVVIRGDDTVVTMTGGDVNTIVALDASTVNMLGGNVGHFDCYDTGIVNLSGGNVTLFWPDGRSTATISGDVSIEDVYVGGRAVVNVSGNAVVSGTLCCWGTSTINISDGTIADISIYGEVPNINLSGGTITTMDIYYIYHGEINLIGHDITQYPYSGAHGSPKVTGFWNDDTAFTISLDGWVYSYMVVYDGTLPPGFSGSNMPDPMTWLMPPAAIGPTSITMTASTATDPCGVEYFFTNTTIGSHDSGWQDSSAYTDTGLAEVTQYTYQVKVRDKSPSPNETAYSGGASATTTDGTAPTPDPMTWAIAPAAAGLTSITMTATTATDASGVEYYFTCTAGGGNDSGWQGGTTYTDTGLSPNTQYTYTVTASDNSSNQNTTAASAPASATTNADTTAPSPDPMTWATVPYAVSDTSISMIATTATDNTSGVEYYFECTAGGGNDSGWQDATTYIDTTLSSATQYSYRVKARDKSTNQNETGWSSTASATTDAVAIGLVAHWSFDEGVGSTAGDSAGNNDGTVHGPDWTTGQVNGALHFDGSSDYVDCGNDSSFDFTDAITISAWVNPSSFPTNYNDIVSKRNAYYFVADSSGHLRVRVYGLSLGWITGNAVLSGWTHVAMTYDGNKIKFYVNGALDIQVDASGSMATSSDDLYIAGVQNHGKTGSDTGRHFNGSIDEVKIFSTALSQASITALYNE